MSLGQLIAKAFLWAYIKLSGLQRALGGVGHLAHCCGLSPWDPPRGPWEGVCSPRICHQYVECLELFGDSQELEDEIDLDQDIKEGLGWYRG